MEYLKIRWTWVGSNQIAELVYTCPFTGKETKADVSNTAAHILITTIGMKRELMEKSVETVV